MNDIDPKHAGPLLFLTITGIYSQPAGPSVPAPDILGTHALRLRARISTQTAGDSFFHNCETEPDSRPAGRIVHDDDLQ